MKQDFVLSLVRAHYENDEDRFKRTALQAAAYSKAADFRESVRALTERTRLMPLHSEASNLVEAVAARSFDDLVLAPSVRAALDEIVAEHRALLQLRARGLDARRRLLFYGPPGNGKTSAASALGAALGISCYAASLPRLVDSLQGSTAANLSKLFPALAAGVCLVFDEIDSIGSERQSGEGAAGKERNHTVNSLLSLLDRTEGGLLIATTNRRDILDPALLRRFDFALEFPAPDTEQRVRLRDALAFHHRVVDRDAIWIDDAFSFDDVTKAVWVAARREAVREAQGQP